MDEEDQAAENEVKNEDLLETKQGVQNPSLWFGLIMIPVVVSLGASFWSVVHSPEAVSSTVSQSLQIEQKEPRQELFIAGKERIWLGGGVRSGEMGSVAGEACQFEALIGQAMTRNVLKDLKVLERYVEIFEDKGQSPNGNAPSRINIYVNKRKIITRVECG